MATVIMIGNQKGGIGKTTTTLELCYLFSQKYKVLGIDLDGSMNFSKSSGAAYEKVPTIRDVLSAECLIEDAIQTVGSFDVIPAHEKLAEAAKEFGDAADIYLLQQALEDVNYDYIFIDNAPSRSPLLYMAYVASDYCLALTDCDENSFDGIYKLNSDIVKFTKINWTTMKFLGIILNKTENTGAHRSAVEELTKIAEECNTRLLNTTLRKGIVVANARKARAAINEFDGSCNLAGDYRELAKEIEDVVQEGAK